MILLFLNAISVININKTINLVEEVFVSHNYYFYQLNASHFSKCFSYLYISLKKIIPQASGRGTVMKTAVLSISLVTSSSFKILKHKR